MPTEGKVQKWQVFVATEAQKTQRIMEKKVIFISNSELFDWKCR